MKKTVNACWPPPGKSGRNKHEYIFENNLPQEYFYAYYSAKRSILLFSIFPLLEDLTKLIISSLRCIFGHSVDGDAIRLALSSNTDTMTLIANMRDPVKYYESKVSHRSNAYNKNGQSDSSGTISRYSLFIMYFTQAIPRNPKRKLFQNADSSS